MHFFSGVTKTQTPKTQTSDPENSDPENSDPEKSDPENSDPENSDPENSDPLKFKLFSIIFTEIDGHLMFIGKSHYGATYLCFGLIAVASTKQRTTNIYHFRFIAVVSIEQ